MAITVIVNNGTGYSETGSGWGGALGTERYCNVSNSYAKFSFTGLTAATKYYLMLTYANGTNKVSNAAFSILDSDGTTVLTSGTINQQNLPIGLIAANTTYYYFPVKVAPTGTSLTLKITNPASQTGGTYIDVIAAAIEPAANFYVSSQTGNWASTSTWGGSGPPGAGDRAYISDGTTVTVADGTTATVGQSGPGSPPAALTLTQTAGGGSLPAGVYLALYTHVSAGGLESICSPEQVITLSASATLVATIPVLPAGVSTANVYLTAASGAAFSETLYATGVGSGANNFTSASWTGGTTTQAAARACPVTTGAALAIFGVGVLAVGSSTGATLNVRGDLILGNVSATRVAGYTTLVTNPGSTLNFDASNASSPTLQRYVVGPLVATVPNTRIKFNGTTGVGRCTVTSNASGGNAQISGRTLNATRYNSVVATFTDFLRLGDATYDSFQVGLDSSVVEPDKLSFHDCTLTSCGRVYEPSAMDGGATFSFQRVFFSTSLGSITVSAFGYPPLTTGVGEVVGCSFDKPTNLTANGWTIGHATDPTQGNFFYGPGIGINTTARPPAIYRMNFLRIAQITGIGSEFQKNYLFYDAPAFGNPDMIQFASDMPAGTYEMSSNICEFNGANGQGDMFDASATLTNLLFNIRYNLILPTPNYPNNPWYPSGKLIGLFGSASQTFLIEHNTMPGGGDNPIFLGDLYNPNTNMLTSVRGNICWDTTRRTPFLKYWLGGTQNPNACSPANADYNALTNMLLTDSGGTGTAAGTAYAIAMTGTAPGIHDVVDQLPNFFDPSRRLSTWGAVRQGTNGTEAAALARLAADPTLIPDLMKWVRQGWMPTNRLYLAASYGADGSPADANGNAWNTGVPGIGAMNVAIPSSGCETAYSDLATNIAF